MAPTHSMYTPGRIRFAAALTLLALASWLHPGTAAAPARSLAQAEINGPVVGPAVTPVSGQLDLARADGSTLAPSAPPAPLKYTPNDSPKGISPAIASWMDAAAQTDFGPGAPAMPGPLASVDGIQFATGGAGWPPDTVGDIGPGYYIQAVNTSIQLFSVSHSPLSITPVGGPISFNNFFPDTLGSPCSANHSGDPVVVYDRFAGRWLITDFAFTSTFSGPYYQCLAISQTANPTGMWNFYAIPVDADWLNDYPKLGVWRNEYVLTYNMFNYNFGWELMGVRVMALEKAPMLSGSSLAPVSFDLPGNWYTTILPAHALDEPGAAEPSYLAMPAAPDQLNLWKLEMNWANPTGSTLSGPQTLDVTPFAAAPSIQQPGTVQYLDSLSPRPMMQLIYRKLDGVERLWLTHTVSNAGIAGMRWYEVRSPETVPILYQHGTYQPDSHHRWMGSLSVDGDGNLALGYSVGSHNLAPGIRATGRLDGEILDRLPQGEAVILAGGGVQTGTSRWGDYSAMAVDPVDDCTFWYTTEYYETSGSNWHTRVAAFRYPSCGQPKGWLQGVVRDSLTNDPIPGVEVTAESGEQKMTVVTDANGAYSIMLAAGSFDLTAAPLLPGYPYSDSAAAISLTAGNTTFTDLFLEPEPSLAEAGEMLVDALPDGNANGFPEPGENLIQLWETLENIGATPSTGVTAEITALTPGVTVDSRLSAYPDLPAGGTGLNLSPFVFSLDRSVTCGTELEFTKTVTDSLRTHTIPFALTAGIPIPNAAVADHSVENGPEGWFGGGINNTWAITDLESHSPNHSWTDSPAGSYLNYTTSYLRSPALPLMGAFGVQISFWTRFELETGWDYVYLDYTTDGASWSSNDQALTILNGHQTDWRQIVVDAPMLDNQPVAAVRFRLATDGSVTGNGVYLDDIRVFYTGRLCLFGTTPTYLPLLNR